MERTDYHLVGEALDGTERFQAQYEPPQLLVIGPVTEFTFGSKNNGSDVGPARKNP
jgi:hypothetical protein